ncbi:hypothetical protein [Streptomyces sp. NPDC091259]|uniref:hypothetical protein n=1 Tax=Streptomyces sp. NPDC091259 TaxID=3365976 RepID=UPI003801E5B1
MPQHILRRLALPATAAAALPMALALGVPAFAAPVTADGPAHSLQAPAAAGHTTAFTPTVKNPSTATASEMAAAAAKSKGAATAPRADMLAAASSVGGSITRGEVLARAQSWVSQGVPYSQTAYWTDANGKYRQDCSGLVSMAWHLQSSSANNFGETTWTLPNFATQLGSYDDLKPGDMLDNVSSHVVLFKSWTDGSHTTANIIEEAHPGTTARNSTYSRSTLTAGNYKPYRYDNITDDVAIRPSTAGVYRSAGSTFYISNTSGGLGGYAGFGTEGDTPLTGDWNGDGKDTFAVYRPSDQTFYLTNDNNTVAVARKLGNPDDIPLVGDWDGNGTDTIGIYRPSDQTFYLTNDNNTVTITRRMGIDGDKPITGDWNGDGKDTIGIYRPDDTTFYLSDSNATASVDHTVKFGNPGDIPVKGDWNGDGTDKVGVYRPAESDFFGAAKDSNTLIYQARFGNPGDTPITGAW